MNAHPLTLRQLLASLDRETLVAACVARCDSGKDTSEGYREVIATMLAYPPTKPSHPLYLHYFPEDHYFVEKGIDTEPDPECVHVNLLNEEYVGEPPADLKPWGCSKGETPPEGHYDCNASCYQRVFGMGDIGWDEIIDAPILFSDEANVRRMLPTDLAIAAEVMNEATWYGFQEEQRQSFWRKITDQRDAYYEAKDREELS